MKFTVLAVALIVAACANAQTPPVVKDFEPGTVFTPENPAGGGPLKSGAQQRG